METNLTIRSAGKFGNRGERLEVLLGNEIIAAGTSPEFAACRVLKDRGATGKAIFWRAGKAHADFTIGIEWGAGRCVVENAKTGPRFAKWAPNPLFGKSEGEELEEAA
jgi:hypothetical protein